MTEHFIVDTNVVAQGELLIRQIDKLPKDVVAMDKEGDRFIVGHSETGHHHVVYEQPGVEVFTSSNDNNSLYLVVNNPKDDVILKHERNFDTHKSFLFKDGVYHIRRQIESSPEGFVRALD